MPMIYFPPRLVPTDECVADPNEQLNGARDRYLDQGIVVLDNVESIKNVQKIVEFARQFDDLRPPA